MASRSRPTIKARRFAVNNMAVDGVPSTSGEIEIKYGSCVQQKCPRPADIVLYGNSTCNNDKNVEIVPIEAHQNILALASLHLREAFAAKGLIESDAKEYKIHQISHETLQLIVACIYQGKVQVTGENAFKRVEDVIVGADYLLMPELVHACGKSLDKPTYLNSSTCVSKWMFADKYHCGVLAVAAARTAATALLAVAKQKEFLTLSQENMARLTENLTAASAAPDALCDAVIAWIEVDGATRKKWCDIVMRHVPFPKMTASGLLRASECKFLSADMLLKVQQVQEVREELDRLKSSFKVILKDYDNLRGRCTNLHKYEDSDDDFNDYRYDDTEVDGEYNKSPARRPGGRFVIARRLVD